MKTITRKQAKETIKSKGLEGSLRMGKLPLTAKQKRFAEGIVLEGLTASDSYRRAYDTQGKPVTVNPNASRLMANSKVQATIDALERAKEVAASQTAEALKSLVVSTLVDVATNSDRDSVRVAAVKTLGTVVGVDMFRETKRIETVKDSSEIRSQIMQQLKTMMLSGDNVQDVDADSLLDELAAGEPHPTPTTPNQDWDSGDSMHTIPLKQSLQNSDSPIASEDPPVQVEELPPGGDIFLENEDSYQDATGRTSTTKGGRTGRTSTARTSSKPSGRTST